METSQNLKEILITKTPITPIDAIAQFGEAFGLSDQQVTELFPDLQNYQGNVELDITDDGSFISIKQADKPLNTYVQLFYGYDVKTGKAKNAIDSIKEHPAHPETVNILLNKCRKNPNDELLRSRFENVIQYAIENGKSTIEDVMFCLISGKADGIIGDDFVQRMFSTYSNWEPFKYLTTKGVFDTARAKEIVKSFTDEYIRGKYGKEFSNFFWSEIMKNVKTQEHLTF